MTPELAYLLKVNLAIAVFYAFYRLFFYKDTFFRLRRTALLVFFALALLYPLFDIQDWVRSKEPMVEVATFYANMLPEEGFVFAYVPDVTESKPQISPSEWAHYGYWGIILFLAARFLIQLSSIILLSCKCRQRKIRGIPVHVLDKPAGPFSFFRLIFIHPESHTPTETEEILAHERTHVRQWHSVDVVICELFSIIFWPNPFVWLLKREVRHNLEYLADNTVIQAGYDSKSYQYHLLALAHHQTPTALYNNFNVLHLKNRISMMNKKRSKSIGRTKYLLFVPLAGILMLLSNIEAVARVTRTFAEDINSKMDASETISLSSGIYDENPENAGENKILYTSPAVTQKIQKSADKDKKAEFPGGEKAMYQFISQNIKYPSHAVENDLQGRVTVEFTIKTDGTISDIEILKSTDPSFDKEAMLLAESMPKWIPAEKDGKKVESRRSIPLVFKLQGKELPADDASPSAADEVVVVAYGKNSKDNLDKEAQFPGGNADMYAFINKTIKYPASAAEKGINGKVICEFVVNEDGSITDAKVIRSIEPSLDEEALRVINAMPKWIPAEKDGKKVKSRKTLPISFATSPKDNSQKLVSSYFVSTSARKNDKFTVTKAGTKTIANSKDSISPEYNKVMGFRTKILRRS